MEIKKPTREEEERYIEACKATLHANPGKLAAAYWNRTGEGAKWMAHQINLGLNDLIDSSVYWACYTIDEKGDPHPVLIGLRTNIPEEWRKFVGNA